MLEHTISPYIVSASDKSNAIVRNGDQTPQDVLQSQVNNCTESSEEDDASQVEDNIVIAGPSNSSSNFPIFEAVSVVNSNDVHFGNKTIYQGPVTIKQIVYSNKKSDINGLESEQRVAEDCDNVACDSEFDGKDNFGFEGTRDAKKSSNIHLDKPIEDDGYKCKVLQLCNFVGKQKHRYILIPFGMAIIFLVIATGIFFWVSRTPTIVDIPINVRKKGMDEEDKQSPVDYSSDSKNNFGPKVRIFTRLEWLAQPPVDKLDNLTLPVSLIIIQHTSTEGCDSQAQCIFQTRIIQTFHIESRGWFDIAYNFLVGGDGNAYEGRGWKMEGAHTFGYNNISIGFGFIGTFNTNLPPPRQIYAFQKLVEQGVHLGYIAKNYKIVAARQLFATESPGKAFFEEIKKWKHWSNTP